MSLTTDPFDPNLRKHGADGQQLSYLILSDEERAKGFARPYRDAYRHLACGHITTMGRALSETYARNPKFYDGTFCLHCKTHFPLLTEEGKRAFTWYEMDGSEKSGVGE